MNTTSARRTLSAFAVLAAVVATPAAQAEPATAVAATESTPMACTAGRLTGLQQRLIDKADQGAAPFVQFIHRTRAIYQLDVYQVLDDLPVWRARGDCRTATVAAADVAGR